MKTVRSRIGSKLGLPPGSLVHIGKENLGKPELELIRFNKDSSEEILLETDEALPDLSGLETVDWLDITGIHDAVLIERIGKTYNLDGLILEDIMNSQQRPKLEVLENHIFLSIKMLHPPKKSGELKLENISLVLGPNFLLSFQEFEGDLFEQIRKRIHDKKGKVSQRNADYLMYLLIDVIVDHYFVVIELLEDRAAQLEERLMEGAEENMYLEITHLRKDLIYYRKSIYPLRDALMSLGRLDHPNIANRTQRYISDVIDHVHSTTESLDSYRDWINSLAALYDSALNQRMNRVMKTLTIISTIFIPMSFIAGVYGMNFDWMPELHQPMGYPIVIGCMFTLAISMLIYFKRNKWW